MTRLLRATCERPRGSRAAECDQQFPPSDGDCHTPLPCEVRKGDDTTPRACCPNSAALGAGEHFTSSRRCEKMLTRAVFSEGDAARPTTASQPPERACKTSKHYRSRLARPLLSKHYRSRWQGRSCPRLLQTRFQRRTKTSTRASKSASVTNAAISFVIRPPIGLCLPPMDDGTTLNKTKERTHSDVTFRRKNGEGRRRRTNPHPPWPRAMSGSVLWPGPGQGYRAGADGGNTPAGVQGRRQKAGRPP